jgi:hypothetical protein
VNARAWAKHEADKTAGALWFASDRCRVRIKLLRGDVHNLKKRVQVADDAFDLAYRKAESRLTEGQLEIYPVDAPELDGLGESLLNETYKLEFTEDFIQETKIKKHLIDTVMDLFLNYWTALFWFVGSVIQVAVNFGQVQIVRSFALPESIRTQPPPIEARPQIQAVAPALI